MANKWSHFWISFVRLLFIEKPSWRGLKSACKQATQGSDGSKPGRAGVHQILQSKGVNTSAPGESLRRPHFMFQWLAACNKMHSRQRIIKAPYQGFATCLQRCVACWRSVSLLCKGASLACKMRRLLAGLRR